MKNIFTSALTAALGMLLVYRQAAACYYIRREPK